MDEAEIELRYKGQPCWFLKRHVDPNKVLIVDDRNKCRAVRIDQVMIPVSP